jgi:predicted nucleotidyltransferase
MSKNIAGLLEDVVLADHDISLLFAVESGSRAFGFASPDSDYDIRGVYRRPVDYYLRLVEGEGDQLNYSDKESGYDLVLWDLKKALKLIAVSNPSLLDWLTSPILYYGSPESLWPVARHYFNPMKYFRANYGLAARHYRKYIRDKPTVEAKVYLYTLRALGACRYVLREPFAPRVDFPFAEEFPEPEVIRQLISQKRENREASSLGPNYGLNSLIENQLEDLGSREWEPFPFLSLDVAEDYFRASLGSASPRDRL